MHYIQCSVSSKIKVLTVINKEHPDFKENPFFFFNLCALRIKMKDFFIIILFEIC